MHAALTKPVELSSVSAQAGVGAVVDSGISVGTQYLTTGQVDPGRVLFDGTFGAVAGGAGPALGDLGSAAVSRLRGGADDVTTPYRNVIDAEFDSITTTGRFGLGPGSMEGKWLALNGADADRWGEVLNRGEGLIVQTAIPNSIFNQFHQHPDELDGPGPGVYADADQLDLINQHGTEIGLWP